MIYKTGTEIYLEEVKHRMCYIPRLSYEEEVQFNYLHEELNRLSAILNCYPGWKQFLMFGARKDYRNLKQQLLDFYDFWRFPISNPVSIWRDTRDKDFFNKASDNQ